MALTAYVLHFKCSSHITRILKQILGWFMDTDFCRNLPKVTIYKDLGTVTTTLTIADYSISKHDISSKSDHKSVTMSVP